MTATTTELLGELRLTRRRRRTADQEWYETLYRAYLVGLAVLYAVLWTSALIRDDRLDADQLADFRRVAPAAVGLLAALVITAGLRSGSRGGPLALEDADVRHLLLAPLDHRLVVRTPTWQRLRSLAFMGLVSGLIVGQAAGRRLPSSIYRWAASCGLVGLCLAVGFGAVAVIAHARRIDERAATVIGGVLIAGQGLALAGWLPAGPLDALGNLALWPLSARPLDLAAVAASAAMVAIAVRFSGQISLERLSRRTALVAQLRFAATMQDLRTVMLLRRQLSLEAVRVRPWFRVRRGTPSWQRSLRSLARFPARRLGRLALLAVAAGGSALAGWRGTTPAVVLAGIAAFLIGLECTEPLSQHLDHPDLADGYPRRTGLVQIRLLTVPALALALVGALTGLLAGTVGAHALDVATGAMLGVAGALGGGIGAIVSSVTGAPDPVKGAKAPVMPPEAAGMAMVARLGFPPALATAAFTPLLLVRDRESAIERFTVAGRSLLAVLVVSALVRYWVLVRPEFRAWWRATLEGGRQAKRGALR